MNYANGIPVVDLKGLPGLKTAKVGDTGDISEITRKLDEGLKSHTCVYLENTGVPTDIVSSLFSLIYISYYVINPPNIFKFVRYYND